MALCLADSLLENDGFHPQDLRLRFLCWWKYGYNNAFALDEKRDRKSSVGLGGNIGASFEEFQVNGGEYTKAGNRSTSGNGSIMRNGAVPIFYHRDIKLAEEVAYKQSKTTHQGDESAECARLLTHICVTAINSEAPSKQILADAANTFNTDLYSVQCLAASRQEERQPSNSEPEELDLGERNWNWQDPDFKFAPKRSLQQPGYIGSYAMDGLAMALHCVFSTDSATAALLKCANLRGDSDTTCAITGQLCGAIYGASAWPKEWVKALNQWDQGSIAMRALKLARHQAPQKKVLDQSPP